MLTACYLLRHAHLAFIAGLYLKPNPGTVGTGIISQITYSNVYGNNTIWTSIDANTVRDRTGRAESCTTAFTVPLSRKVAAPLQNLLRCPHSLEKCSNSRSSPATAPTRGAHSSSHYSTRRARFSRACPSSTCAWTTWSSRTRCSPSTPSDAPMRPRARASRAISPAPAGVRPSRAAAAAALCGALLLAVRDASLAFVGMMIMANPPGAELCLPCS